MSFLDIREGGLEFNDDFFLSKIPEIPAIFNPAKSRTLE